MPTARQCCSNLQPLLFALTSPRIGKLGPLSMQARRLSRSTRSARPLHLAVAQGKWFRDRSRAHCTVTAGAAGSNRAGRT